MSFLTNLLASTRISITCVLKTNVFFPGNIIEGVVLLDVSSPVNFTAIRVKFCGKEYVDIHKGGDGHGHSHSYSQTNAFLKQLLTLAGDLKYNSFNRKGSYNLPAGRYSYPFAFQLPFDLPPSFCRRISDDTATIRYYVKAYVDIPNGRDAVYKTFFTVVRPMPASQWANRIPVTVDRYFDVTLCCCIDKGRVNARLSMDRTCIAMDRDWLQVFAAIDNTGGEEAVESIEITLRHTLTYVARGMTETNSYVAGSRFLNAGIAAKQRGTINGVIDLPRNLIPSFMTPGIKSSYVIVIELNIPWATDPSQSFPVIISQAVDDSNMTPPVSFNNTGGMQFLGSHTACQEYFYQPPPQPIAAFAPVQGWTAPAGAGFMPPPPPPQLPLPSQSWVQGNPPPEPLGTPPMHTPQWQSGYQQQQSPEYSMAPPLAEPLGASGVANHPQQQLPPTTGCAPLQPVSAYGAPPPLAGYQTAPYGSTPPNQAPAPYGQPPPNG